MIIDEKFCLEKCFVCYFWKWANLNRQTDTEKCKLEEQFLQLKLNLENGREASSGNLYLVLRWNQSGAFIPAWNLQLNVENFLQKYFSRYLISEVNWDFFY